MEERRLLSAGALDPTFGSGGTVTTNFNGPAYNNITAALAVTQPDGKVVAVENILGANNQNQMTAVRYNTDGSLDSSFGTGGEAVFQFHGLDHAAAAALDSQGRLVVVGLTENFPSPDLSGHQDFAITRLNTDGSVDMTFGNNGLAVVNIGLVSNSTATFDEATSLALDASGRIVVAGNTFDGNGPNYGTYLVALTRLNTDGSLDTTFGSGGKAAISFGTASFRNYANHVAVDSSGRIVVEGSTENTAIFGDSTGAVARLNANGTPDTNFGSGGTATIRLGPGLLETDLRGMALDASGRIVVAGNFTASRTSDIVARLNATDGSLDGSFGAGGVQTISFSTNDYYDQVSDITVDAAGKIILASRNIITNIRDVDAVARLNGTDGSLDGSFGVGGKTTIVVGQFGGAPKVAFDPAGRIVLADLDFSDNGLAVVRLTAAGALDNNFGLNGQVITHVPGFTASVATRVVNQPDGKSVVVGTSTDRFNEIYLALARYNPDGSLDASFGSGGKVTFGPTTGLNVVPRAVTLDRSGRILLAGDTYNNYTARDALLRLNADGSPDTSFGVGGLVVGISTVANGLAVDPVGRIVIGQYNSVTRLNADGTRDASFGNNGTVVNAGIVNAGVAIDATGRIVVMGSASVSLPSVGTQFGIVRLNTNGTPDTTFGTGGETTFTLGNSQDQPQAVAIDSAGHIDVAGTMFNGLGNGWVLGVFQLNADGKLNTGFGIGGKTVFNSSEQYMPNDPVSMAVDATNRIALAGNGINRQNIVHLLKSDGRTEADFGTVGRVTNSDPISAVAGVAFDASGRLIVASSTTARTDQGIAFDNRPNVFVLTRYLTHDPVVEAASSNFAADLQAAITALQTTPVVGTPRVVIHADNPAEMSKVTAALARLSVNPAGPSVEVLLDLDAGAYTLGRVSVPTGLSLILDGYGGAFASATFAGSSGPALTVVSGDVIVRDRAVFTGSGKVPAILVQGGQLTVRNSTITENTTTTTTEAALVITGGQVDLGTLNDPGYNTFRVNGTGVAIRLSGPNDVLAIGNIFQVNGQSLSNNYQIEDAIRHSLDGLRGGTLFWVPNNVFVSVNSGSIQHGVDAVPVAGMVHVQTGVKGGYNAGSKLLTIAFDNAPTITQQVDFRDATKRSLVVADYYGTYNTIKFTAGQNPGEVDLKINALPKGKFLPTGRLIAYGGNGDTIEAGSGVFLPAWLYGGGNGSLKGGSGNNVLISYGSGDVLTGGAGRSLLIGAGGDTLQGSSGQDILIAGYTNYDFDEFALAAIMAEWTSTDSLAKRVANIADDTASPLFSASRKNGDYFLIDSGSNQTVFNDFSAGTVTAGSGRDWIFAGSFDTIIGLKRNDVLFLFGA